MSEHVIWTQWDDLNVPSKFKKLSPATTPIEGGDFSEVTFYVPWYMGGRPALEMTKKMPNLKVLQVPNAGYDDAIEYIRPGITLCNGKSIHDDSTAELAVGLTIASLRGFPDFIRNQDKSEWVHVKNKSIIIVIDLSILPLKYPAFIPINSPTIDEIDAAKNPIISDV